MKLDPRKSDVAAEIMASVAAMTGTRMGSFELAEVLALAYGDACGMLGVSGAPAETFDRLNEMATLSAFDMARRVVIQAGGAGQA